MKSVLAVVILAAFTGVSFAQGQAPAAAPAAPAKTEKPAAKAEVKKAEVTTGELASMDAAKGEIVVKNAKGEMKTFAVEAAKQAGLTVGEKVKVTVKGAMVTVKPVKEMGKHEGKKAGKKPEAPKPAEAKK